MNNLSVLKNSINTSKNIVKNVCNYTINIAPRTARSIKQGRREGDILSKSANAGKLKTFVNKRVSVAKTLADDIKFFEIPFILSAVTLPAPIFFISPLAFLAGCGLITPIILKKFAKKELTVAQLKDYYDKLKQKDFIQPDDSVKEFFRKKK